MAFSRPQRSLRAHQTQVWKPNGPFGNQHRLAPYKFISLSRQNSGKQLKIRISNASLTSKLKIVCPLNANLIL
jgi:hypothetical protein